ncbi:hypothetical protein FHS39_000869 [Streptomyces olivoverticillatus]|uniref:Uncharacterized protein n=1 Tax=Streptomyces olivoverticillatus TaxID=66427 RepID=A0A7W7LKS4_9ACTN|nr:hypothetical protein [Streptomyces olivoverticillatus]MBB4891869.1 hypothetical protein [Streptomyces olivoverticillatus]
MRELSFVTQEQATVVNPQAVGGGDHTMFVAGDHADAKKQATELLKEYGWTDILDVGPWCAPVAWRCTPTCTPPSASASSSAATSASKSCAEPFPVVERRSP